ncbi:MAG TPA: type II toxin-antitoxin system RelE/ParE family toxin [Ignavibacteriaceae bacterium]|nr:type II toxin-antitoxin system RelE/ParE family toxin [Ignavibacteriaceae bacterium]
MKEIIFYKTPRGDSQVEEFIDSLNIKQARKVVWTLRLIRDLERVPEEYLKKLKSSDDIWEIRVQFGGNIFRFLGFFESNRIILTNAFSKKTQKTPEKEIELAKQRKKEYYERKK